MSIKFLQSIIVDFFLWIDEFEITQAQERKRTGYKETKIILLKNKGEYFYYYFLENKNTKRERTTRKTKLNNILLVDKEKKKVHIFVYWLLL